MLQKAGYEVRPAASGREIDQIVESGTPALVLLEPMVPGQDGFKLCASFKKRGGKPAPAVIVASRIYRGQRYRNMAKEAGADAYFERPQQDDQLVPLIAKLMPAMPQIASTPSTGPTTTGGFAPQITPPAIPAMPVPRSATGPATGQTTPAARVPTAAPPSKVVGTGFDAPSELPGFNSFSDGDIDDALSRILGEEPPVSTRTERHTSPTSAPPIQRAAAIDFDQEQSLEFDVPLEPISATADPAAAVDFGALASALERSELALSGPTATSGTADGPAGHATASPFGYDDPAPSVSGSVPSAEFVVDDSVIELEAETPSGPEAMFEFATHLEANVREVRQAERPSDAFSLDDDGLDEDVDALLERALQSPVPRTAAPRPAAAQKTTALPDVALVINDETAPTGYAKPIAKTPPPVGLSGDSLVDPALDTSHDAYTGPPPFANVGTEVSPGLRGMDPGTAELLESLEELESSLPAEDVPSIATPVGASAADWNSGFEIEESIVGLDSTPASSIDRRPPTRTQENSLQEVMARLTGGDEPELNRNDELIFSSLADSMPQTRVPERTAPPIVSQRGRLDTGSAEASDEPDADRGSSWSTWGWYSLIGVLAGALALYAGSQLMARDTAHEAILSTTTAPRPSTSPSSGAPFTPGDSRHTSTTSTKPVQGSPPTSVLASAGNSRRQLPDGAPAASSRRADGSTTQDTEPAAARRSKPAPLTDKRTPRKPKESALQESGGRPATVIASSPRAGIELYDQVQPVHTTPAAEEPSPHFATARTITDSAPLVKIAELDEPLRVLESGMPPLTEEAARAGVRGRVFLSVLVDGDGSVKDAKVMMEPGFGLGEAARRAVREWKYSRPKRSGSAARVWKTEVLEFEGGGRSTPSPEPQGSGAEAPQRP